MRGEEARGSDQIIVVIISTGGEHVNKKSIAGKASGTGGDCDFGRIRLD